jgi:hypothetical protein
MSVVMKDHLDSRAALFALLSPVSTQADEAAQDFPREEAGNLPGIDQPNRASRVRVDEKGPQEAREQRAPRRKALLAPRPCLAAATPHQGTRLDRLSIVERIRVIRPSRRELPTRGGALLVDFVIKQLRWVIVHIALIVTTCCTGSEIRKQSYRAPNSLRGLFAQHHSHIPLLPC